MSEAKINYLRDFPSLISSLKPEAKGKWGKMNAWQMAEHMSYALRVASGKIKEPAMLTPEQTQKSYAFMMSEKPFRENTPNQLLPEEPLPYKNASWQEALSELRKETDDFFIAYSSSTELRVQNPFFGKLDFHEQVQLLHKHASHHARQFGL